MFSRKLYWLKTPLVLVVTILIVPCVLVFAIIGGVKWGEQVIFKLDEYNRAESEFYRAWETKDWNRALDRAVLCEEIIRRQRAKRGDNSTQYRSVSLYLTRINCARANEALERYAAAINYYQTSKIDEMRSELNIPRVEYKQGCRKKAFRDYCLYADSPIDVRVKRARSVVGSVPEAEERLRVLAVARKTITLETLDERFLSPFFEYADFLQFMEEEYKELGEPQEYAVAMEFFRDVERNKAACDHWIEERTHAEIPEFRATLAAERAVKAAPDGKTK